MHRQRVGQPNTISFRSRARAASIPAGLGPRNVSVPPRLMSAWMRALLLCIFWMSRQDPPLEFKMPLRLLGSGGIPDTGETPPPREPAVLCTFPFIPTQSADPGPSRRCRYAVCDHLQMHIQFCFKLSEHHTLVILSPSQQQNKTVLAAA